MVRACCGALLLASSSAWADPPPATPALPSAPAPSRAAAAAAHDKGKRLLDQGAYAEALSEFTRAYELSPAYKVLYIIGGLNLRLERWVEARRAYELYLELGGPELSPARSAEVHGYLEELSQKTATLTLQLNVPAVVYLDGVPFESTQVTGLILAPGEHVVRVSKPGFEPLEQVVRTTDGQDLHLVLPLARVSSGEPALPAQNPFGATPSPRLESAGNVGADQRVSLWIPWTVTGALAAGWMTTAGLAIKARHDRDIIERPETPQNRIDDARRLHQTLAIVSDVLLVSTLASAGVSAYLTWWPPPDPAVSGSTGEALIGIDGLHVGVRGEL
jgi:PEGA domain-containing protein